jgi:hypothetical protein
MTKSYKGNERKKNENVKGGVKEHNCRTIKNTVRNSCTPST